ncbi:pentapeptide repeat-containing protein [Streptomyces sioyaensis]|uniref:pentapeptide repeat-containing protein n=1 Tax=Streptomyces sioyaensis TaxID=67364 RepID=UPI00371F31B1
MTTPASSASSPSWPFCGMGADATRGDPVGCRGRIVAPYSRCLADLDEPDRQTYLGTLRPGSDVDHRGTTFTTVLLRELTSALHDEDGHPLFGDAQFTMARFGGDAEFYEARFSGTTVFDGATFSSTAWFERATFSGYATFAGVRFGGYARFAGATFSSTTWFDRAMFSDDAQLYGATFSGYTTFSGATFSGTARFKRATFERAARLGPLVCGERLVLSGAVFHRPVTIEAAAQRLECVRTQWMSTAGLRLRYATVDLTDAVFEYPLTVASRGAPWTTIEGGPVMEQVLADLPWTVRIASLSGVDAAHLVLTDIDLSDCRFAGTVHLDQLRLEGECPLAQTPRGVRWRRGLPLRWTVRGSLVEEHHWRHRSGASGWAAAPEGMDALEPAALAPVYRQLRKAFEDAKNEPEATDFYYGEMEMRRKNNKRSFPERGLLTLYWAVSGYGLRASRALAWLFIAMLTTTMLMTLWGVAKDDPKPESKGTVKGQQIALTTDKPDPVNPDGSLASRVSTDRFEKSLRVVINSVVFRSSGQDLTTAGTYMEMASRLVEPVLLGLAVLAVRGRVKR